MLKRRNSRFWEAIKQELFSNIMPIFHPCKQICLTKIDTCQHVKPINNCLIMHCILGFELIAILFIQTHCYAWLLLLLCTTLLNMSYNGINKMLVFFNLIWESVVKHNVCINIYLTNGLISEHGTKHTNHIMQRDRVHQKVLPPRRHLSKSTPKLKNVR